MLCGGTEKRVSLEARGTFQTRSDRTGAAAPASGFLPVVGSIIVDLQLAEISDTSLLVGVR